MIWKLNPKDGKYYYGGYYDGYEKNPYNPEPKDYNPDITNYTVCSKCKKKFVAIKENNSDPSILCPECIAKIKRNSEKESEHKIENLLYMTDISLKEKRLYLEILNSKKIKNTSM